MFYRDTDGQIAELFRGPGQKWSFTNLSTQTKAPKAASDPAAYFLNGAQHVAYRGSNGHIQELFMPPQGTWAHTDLSNMAKAP